MPDTLDKLATTDLSLKGHSSDYAAKTQKQGSLVDAIIDKSDSKQNDVEHIRTASGEDLGAILDSIRSIINNHRQVISASQTFINDANHSNKQKNIADLSYTELHQRDDIKLDTQQSSLELMTKSEVVDRDQDLDHQFQELNAINANTDTLELTDILELDQEYIVGIEDDLSDKGRSLQDHKISVTTSYADFAVISKDLANKSSQMIEEFLNNTPRNTDIQEINDKSQTSCNSFGTDSGEEKFNQMVCQLLRPMMRDWLDNNLPDIVHKIIKDEIKKITPKK